MTDEATASNLLFQLSGVGVVETDLSSGRLVRANETFCEWLGYSETELQTTTYLELTHPDDRDRDAAGFTALVRGEQQEGTSLTRVMHKDGSVRWLELHITVTGEGDEARNLTVATDVTERHRAVELAAFRVRLSDALRPLHDPLEVQMAASRLVGEQLGVDRAAYAELEAGEQLMSVTHDWTAPGTPSVAGRYRIDDFGKLFTDPLREGQASVVGDAATDPRVARPVYESTWAGVGVRAAVAYPLVKQGRFVAAFFVHDGKPRTWLPNEVALVAEVGERTWEAVERARAEGARREAGERLALALEAARMGEWSLDLTTGAATRSALHDRIFGYEQPLLDWSYERFLDHVHPDNRALVAGAFERSRRTGDDWAFECRITRADGETRWIWALGSTRGVGAPGGGGRMYGLVNDVTDRKRDEAALRDLNDTLEARVEERSAALARSNLRFTQAFYLNPVPACMTTLGRETFVEVNDAFLALTGYAREEVIGRTALELGMWSSPGDQRKVDTALAQNRGFRELDLQVRHQDGGVNDVLLSAETIRLDGHEGYLKMFYDVTDRKRTEEQTHRAIQEVMSDTNWFSQRVMERLAQIRTGGQATYEPVELTKRERDVLERLARGVNNEVIAAELGVAVQTVRNYISAVYDKLGVRTRAEAIVWARERGIVG